MRTFETATISDVTLLTFHLYNNRSIRFLYDLTRSSW